MHNIVWTIYLLLAGLSDNVLKPLLLGRVVDAPTPGSAVGDSVTGRDVCQVFVVRMNRFIDVTLDAWLADYVLEQLRTCRRGRVSSPLPNSEVPGC